MVRLCHQAIFELISKLIVHNESRWEGIPVVYVNAWGTSSKCSRCGSNMKPEENRMLRCVSCKLSIDRDINAARNILAGGLRFEPVGSR